MDRHFSWPAVSIIFKVNSQSCRQTIEFLKSKPHEGTIFSKNIWLEYRKIRDDFPHRTLQERQLQALEFPPPHNNSFPLFYLLRFILKQLSELLSARSLLRGILDTAEDDIFQLMLTHHLDVTLTAFPFWYLSTICSIQREKIIIYCKKS